MKEIVPFLAFFIILCLLNNNTVCMEESKKDVSTQKTPTNQQPLDDAYREQALAYVYHRTQKEEAFWEMFAGDQFKNSPPGSSAKIKKSELNKRNKNLN